MCVPKLHNLLSVIGDAYRKRGVRYLFHHGPLVLYRTCLGGNRGFFIFQNQRYNYFYHLYNSTCLNERAVEIPIVWKIVEEHQGGRILEVGNVLSHYFKFPHDVVDKNEKFEGVINQDIIGFRPKEKYDLIVSISTLEHVGEGEEPTEPPKILAAIQNLKECLAPGGKMVVTLSLGYNPEVDKLLNEGKIAFTEQHFLKKSDSGEWQETNWNGVLGTPYDFLNFSARGLLIGIDIK